MQTANLRLDPLSLLVAVVGLATAAFAALSVTGAVERPPEPGCINTEGDNKATVANEAARLFAGPSPNADPLGLALRGCKLQYGGYWIGEVHRDVSENTVLDSRWLILSDDQRLIASGDTVGTTPAVGPSSSKRCKG